MIRLHHGNRLERLGDALADVLAQPLGSPLAPDIVLVQSNGMARWLSLRLATHNRVCANVRFPYPAGFVWELFRALKPELPELSRFEPDVLTWRLYGLLPTLLDDPCYADLANYLRGGEAIDRFELARRVADIYDQYLVYRPDWIVGWQSGDENHWQAALWRALCGDGEAHRAQLLDDVIRQLSEQPRSGLLPERISLFGAASLPQPYVALLEALGRHCEVNLFLLNPSSEYWGQIRSEREIHRRAGGADPEALYLETGNKLLASWGRQGREFLELLLSHDCEQAEYFDAPEGESLLANLQHDILRLANRGEDGAKTPLADDDRSLQIHSCHSAMREVEVLHDQLLQLFADDPTLSPADVAVMTPDVEAYAPYVDAVFASADSNRIPYAIADRSIRREQPVVECFLKLLALGDGRFEADRLVELLEVAPLRARFGISETDLPRLHDWVRRAGIRWGIDAEHRARLGLPPVADHSWRQGLDRMLLGYAMPARQRRLFGGILPFDEVEGSGAELAGHLLAYIEAVFALVDQLAHDRPIHEWRDLLNDLLDRFFQPEHADDQALTQPRQALDDLARAAELAGVTEAVPLTVVAGSLRRRLEAPGGVGSFLSGGVTFCAMVPMRSIPFRVVCVLGMNDGEFPRQQRPLGFDLIARHPRPGDRSRRFEDRFLFLEALLSARDCLYLSYIGQSIRDNSTLPPSVMIDELLDYIDQGWLASEGGSVRDRLVTRHRLQAFSPAYFDGQSAKLFSYAGYLCEAGELAGRGGRRREPLLAAPLPEPDDSWRNVELSQLVAFWRCPAEFLLRHRLGIRLDQRAPLLESREPFVLDGLDNWQLSQDLLELTLAGSPESPEEYARAAGRLPHGVVGEEVLAAQLGRVKTFTERLATLAQVADAQPFTLQLGDFRLTGVLDRLSADGRVDYRFGRDRSKDLLGVWINHLVLNAIAPAGVPLRSRWLSEDTDLTLQPLTDAHESLEFLLHWYWQGLTEPLPFLPKASYAWVEQKRKGKDGLDAARKAWHGDDRRAGECGEPYLALAFADTEPMSDGRFVELAESLWLPLFTAAEEQP